MSFQITVLKVLAGHPGGQASLAELRSAVAILMTSGKDWTDRTRRLAARAPDLDIFGQALVVRNPTGWRITEAGLAVLAEIESPAVAPPVEKVSSDRPAELITYSTSAPMPMYIIGRRQRRPGRRRARRPAA